MLINAIIRFAHQHDEIPAFHAAYLVAVFLAAAVFNLGFFLLLILLHIFLDLLKYHSLYRYDGWTVLRATVLENLFDITLFTVALVTYIYFHHLYVFAALGLSRSALSLFLAFATLLPKMGILEDIVDIVGHLKRHLHSTVLGGRVLAGQRVMVCVLIASVLALAFAPVFYSHHSIDLAQTLSDELTPWKL